jgi:hypothetical protein
MQQEHVTVFDYKKAFQTVLHFIKIVRIPSKDINFKWTEVLISCCDKDNKHNVLLSCIFPLTVYVFWRCI